MKVSLVYTIKLEESLKGRLMVRKISKPVTVIVSAQDEV